MVRHVILWQLKDGLSAGEKEEAKRRIKASLEALAGVVPGLRSIAVQADGLPTGNADVMLDALLDDEAALAGYAVHPAHVAAAETCVKPVVKSRTCMDFVAV